MRLEWIECRNWMPFGGDHRIGPLPALPIAVVGEYEENQRRSNWAGKTALLELIRWVLFGVHRKRLDDDVITHGAVDVWGSLRFTSGLVIERKRPRGKPTRLIVTTAEGAQLEAVPAQEHIDAMLKLSREDFEATLYVGQGDTEALVARKSAERRQIMAEWLRLDVWDRLLARAKLVAKRLDEEAARLSVIVPTRPRSELEEELERARAAHDVAEREFKLAETELAAMRKAAAPARKVREAEEAAGTARRLKQALVDGAAAPGGVEQARDSWAAAAAQEQDARREHGQARELAAGRFDGVCPVIRAECPAASHVRAQASAAEKRIGAASLALQDASGRSQEARQKLACAEQLEADRQRRVAEYNAAALRARELAAAIKQMSPEEVAAARAFDEALLSKVERDHQRAAVTRAEAAAQVRALENSLKVVDMEEAREKSRLESLEKVRGRRAAVDLLLRAFAPTGVQARIARVRMADLEARANAALQGTGLSFVLAWDRETKDLAAACGCGYSFRSAVEKVCHICETPRGRRKVHDLEVLVDDGSGEAEDVRAKSGGAKALVGMAIRLAGGAMLRDLRGSLVAFAEVDEPFGALDQENRAYLARSLTSMLGSVGLEQAFVVSHDASILSSMPARIVVRRSGSLSRLELET